MENMLAGHKLYFSLQNYLHKRLSYHQIFALSKTINLLRERKEKESTVAKATSRIAESLLSKTGYTGFSSLFQGLLQTLSLSFNVVKFEAIVNWVMPEPNDSPCCF